MRNIFLIIILLSSVFGQAQEKINGKVTDDKNLPLPGASVYWLNTTIGTSTTGEGTFDLPYKPE